MASRRVLPWEITSADRRGGTRRFQESAESVVPEQLAQVTDDDPHLEETRGRLLKAKAMVYGRMYAKAHNVVESLGPSATLSYAQSGEPELYSPELLAAR
jgi:hypothetical protein